MIYEKYKNLFLNYKDSNYNKQKLIKEISVDFDLVNSECENFEKASKLKDDKLIDLEKAFQEINTDYDKLLVQNDVLLKQKNDLINRIVKLENYVADLENIKKSKLFILTTIIKNIK